MSEDAENARVNNIRDEAAVILMSSRVLSSVAPCSASTTLKISKRSADVAGITAVLSVIMR